MEFAIDAWKLIGTGYANCLFDTAKQQKIAKRSRTECEMAGLSGAENKAVGDNFTSSKRAAFCSAEKLKKVRR